ncbi:MAG: DUF368 domain-containing protein [Spirochaetia bacterium]
MPKNFVHFFYLIIKGIMIGVANIIPGVSGGTIAVSLGIYQPLIDTISHLPTLIKNKNERPNLFSFLLPLLIGVGMGFVLFAKAMSWLLQYQPINSQLFFVGLILGCIPLIFQLANMKRYPWSSAIGLMMGLLVMGIFFYLSLQKNTHSSLLLPLTNERLQCIWFQLKMIGCGFVAAFAMVIPGISGSLLLVILGEYTNILAIISRVTSLEGALDWSYSLVAFSLFGVGIIAGIVSCAKSMHWFLKNYQTLTMSFILGLMLFSIVWIWPASLNQMPAMIINILCLVLGATTAYRLGQQH